MQPCKQDCQRRLHAVEAAAELLFDLVDDLAARATDMPLRDYNAV
jgi:hypothetical protein